MENKEKMRLFEISKEYQNILNDIEDALGEIDNEKLQELTYIEDKAEIKLKNYTTIIEKYETEIDYIDKRIKQLTKLKKNRQRIIESLKYNMLDFLKRTGIDEFDFYGRKIKYGRKTQKVIIENLESLPEKFIKIKKEADKIAVKDYWKKNKIVPEGAIIVESEHIKIV